ncbi:ABC transporter ATP-binding protein [Sandarakinorhabdus sp. DWP1-3-1]|uniref:ABC transporter ATP-binding protein n=1 Tax=Sandarakinorhabdus sp. DWP1-3-1 TaxID=2804627 RepID=UPI003CED9DBC
MTAILDIAGLTLDFVGHDGNLVRVLHGIDLGLAAGETLALVGESGSGKSVTSLAILGLLDRRTARIGGEIRLHGPAGPRNLLELTPTALTKVRGAEIAMVFQEPMTSLNPVMTIAAQLAEPLRLHQALRGTALRDAVLASLAEVGIPDPARRAAAYPHELSGGMRQRVVIAIALACNPRLLIADEPTTALDVTIQAQILDLLQTLQRRRGMAMLFISHSLGVVAEIADRVAVMYAGRIVEAAPAAAIFAQPRHPYTAGLLASLPGGRRGQRLRAIPGAIVDPRAPPPGCAFAPRCDRMIYACNAGVVAMASVAAGHASRCLRWAEA